MSGAFSSLGIALVHPLIVLPLFIASVTDSLAAAVMPAILLVAGRLVAAPVSRLLLHGPNGTFWLIGIGALRGILAGMLALIVSRSEDLSPNRITAAFLIGLAAFAIADGLVTPLMISAAGRALPQAAEAPFLRLRRIFSGIAALVAAPVLASVLGQDGPGAPGNYTLLLIVATICYAITVFFTLPLHVAGRAEQAEPPDAAERLAGTTGGRFALFRFVIGSSALFDPLIALYAVQTLSADATTVGWLLAFFALGNLASEPLALAITGHFGARLAYQLLAVSRLVASVIVLAVPQIIETELWTERVEPGQAAPLLLGTSLIFVGATQAGLRAIESVAAGAAGRLGRISRSTRLIAAVASFSPLLGAWIIERTGSFADAFLVGGGLSLLAILLSGLLPERLSGPRTAVGPMPSRTSAPAGSVLESPQHLNGRTP
jgi:hypothetical protein